MKSEFISQISDDKLFIISSHDISEFDMLFSHIAIIKDHRITTLFDCEEIRNGGETVAEFFGREIL